MALVGLLTGCSSTSPQPAESTPPTTVVAGPATTSSSPVQSSSAETVPATEPTSPAETTSVDSATPAPPTSPQSPGPIGAARAPVLVDKPDSTGTTLTLTAAGTFDKPVVSISTGMTVTFAVESGYHGIKVGANDAVTTAPKVPTIYQFPAPGIFQVVDELTSAKTSVIVT